MNLFQESVVLEMPSQSVHADRKKVADVYALTAAISLHVLQSLQDLYIVTIVSQKEILEELLPFSIHRILAVNNLVWLSDFTHAGTSVQSLCRPVNHHGQMS